MSQQVTDSLRATGRGYIIAAMAAYMGSYSVGTLAAYSSPVAKELEEKFKDIDISLFGSLLTFGALFSSFFTAWLVETLGRRGTILLSATVMSTGWTIFLVGNSSMILYISRFVAGASLGVIGGVLPTYVTEIATPEHRGIIGAGHQVGCVIGVLSVYILGSALDSVYLAFASLVPCAGTVVAMIFMPESPEWMISKKKDINDIKNALHQLYGDSDYADTFAARMNEVDFETAPASRSSFSDLLHRSALRPFLVSVNLCLSQQLTGMQAVISYSAKIFEASGSTLSPSLQSIIIGSVQVVFTILAAYLMDKAGRRILMIISSGSLIFSLLLLIGFFSVNDTTGDFKASFGWLPVVAMSIYMAGFSLGIGPVPWLMAGELMPTRIRGLGIGILTGVNWVAASIITKVFPGLLDGPGPVVTYSLLTAMTGVCSIITFFTVPETKGKSLEEIEKMFDNGDSDTRAIKEDDDNDTEV